VTAPILTGAEPYSAVGDARGALVLHGFTGNTQSMRGLAVALADAGLTVELPLLPGHGTAVEDMVPTRWEDWSAAAEAQYLALAARCDKVVVVGLSVGGALTCWLAEHHSEISGVAVINPMIDPPSDEMREMGRGLLADGVEVIDGVGSDIAKEGPVESAYPTLPLAPALSLAEGLESVVEALGEIHCPALLLSSRVDHTVDPVSGDILVREYGGPLERLHLEHSYHVATLDHDAALVEERVVAFALETMGGPGASSA
jgi:carboxylesterase